MTWGTSPQDVLPITGAVPNPADEADAQKRAAMERSLDYMGLKPGTLLEGGVGRSASSSAPAPTAASRICAPRRRSPRAARSRPASTRWSCRAPASSKQQAEEEGLDKIFIEAGFEWREPGCSMCLAMNADKLEPGERCASTSNRNFEGRQGRGGRTHLMSPAMAAAAAVTGKLADIRELR